VKDAALDAADIVRGSATMALDGARRASASLLDGASSAPEVRKPLMASESAPAASSSSAGGEPPFTDDAAAKFEAPTREDGSAANDVRQEAEELID